jgi:hypothetical protein
LPPQGSVLFRHVAAGSGLERLLSSGFLASRPSLWLLSSCETTAGLELALLEVGEMACVGSEVVCSLDVPGPALDSSALGPLFASAGFQLNECSPLDASDGRAMLLCCAAKVRYTGVQLAEALAESRKAELEAGEDSWAA